MVLDITFDLETCALCPTAAVMSIAAVAWHRTADATPFIGDERFSFRANIDLKSAFVDGFTFDADTARWWRRQSEEAKRHLFAGGKQEHLRDAVERFIQWIVTTARMAGADEVCLWAKGQTTIQPYCAMYAIYMALTSTRRLRYLIHMCGITVPSSSRGHICCVRAWALSTARRMPMTWWIATKARGVPMTLYMTASAAYTPCGR